MRICVRQAQAAWDKHNITHREAVDLEQVLVRGVSRLLAGVQKLADACGSVPSQPSASSVEKLLPVICHVLEQL